jgi:TIR domain
MSGNVFLNYRRADDAGFATALFQHLDRSLGHRRIFMDVEGFIKPGDDFVIVLSEQVAACDVVLVVIGPKWLDLLGARSELADDFVAIEISAAIQQGKRIIPVLVNGARMPSLEALPTELRPLSRRHAVSIRPDRFRADCDALAEALKSDISAAEQSRSRRRPVVESPPAAGLPQSPPPTPPARSYIPQPDVPTRSVNPNFADPFLLKLETNNQDREKVFVRAFDDQLQEGEKTQFARLFALSYVLIIASAVAFALFVALPIVAKIYGR